MVMIPAAHIRLPKICLSFPVLISRITQMFFYTVFFCTNLTNHTNLFFYTVSLFLTNTDSHGDSRKALGSVLSRMVSPALEREGVRGRVGFDSSTLQLFDSSTLRLFNSSTLQLFNSSPYSYPLFWVRLLLVWSAVCGMGKTVR